MKEDLRSWDPREVRLLSEINLIKHMYEGLVQENPLTGDLEPALAESYSISEDGSTYTFHLKEAYWSNGDPITAADFVRSWKQALFHEVDSAFPFAFDDVRCDGNGQDEPFFASDERTLVVHASPHLLKKLAMPVFFPVHKNQNANPKALPIVSGAFYPKSSKNKQWLKLAKNPHYYAKNRVHTQSITIYFVPDPHTALLLFNQGKLNWQGPPWGDHIPREAISTLRAQGTLRSFDVAGTSWLTYNINHPFFSNLKLRKALGLALNKEAFVSTLFSKPAEHLLPTSLHSYPELPQEPREQRQHLARLLFTEALEELGISVKDLEQCSMIFPSSSSASSLLVQMVREQWKEVLGLSIPIKGMEFSVMQADIVSGNFAIATGGWFADFTDPLAFLSIFAFPKGLPPYALDHKEFSSLLFQIEHEQDQEKRQALVSQASLFLERNHIIEPMYHDIFYFALNKNLSNIGLSPTGWVDFRYATDYHHG